MHAEGDGHPSTSLNSPRQVAEPYFFHHETHSSRRNKSLQNSCWAATGGKCGGHNPRLDAQRQPVLILKVGLPFPNEIYSPFLSASALIVADEHCSRWVFENQGGVESRAAYAEARSSLNVLTRGYPRPHGEE